MATGTEWFHQSGNGPVRTGSVQIQSGPVRVKPWTGIGPIPNSVGPGLDWTGPVLTSPALCPQLSYISHCTGLLMGEIYLDGTEYTDRTVIISPRVCIQRWVVVKCEDESCFQWYLTMKQCRNCKRVWTGRSPTPDWVRPDRWIHCRDWLQPMLTIPMSTEKRVLNPP